MAVNTIENRTLFMEACDQQLIEGATSGWMEANAGQVKYTGGDTVKIPTLSTTGLGDYDRNAGYPKGGVSVKYQSKTMTQDRGTSFFIDRIEVDESGFIATAASAAAIFQKEHVVPEVDAYRYSKLYKLAKEKGNVTEYTPAASTILSALQKDITKVRDSGAGAADLVIIMPYTVADIFDNSDKLTKHINVGQFNQGGVDMEVKTFNGIPIIRVPSDRMKTLYDFMSGETEFGFAPAEGAVQINWIICPRSVPIAVSKTDGVYIYDPETTQGADAWKVEYRKFHDLWVKDEQLKTVRVCAEPAQKKPDPENKDTGNEDEGGEET